MALDSGKEIRRPHTREKIEADQRTLEDRSMRERSETGAHSRRTLPADKKNPRDIRQLNSIGEGEYDTDHERRMRIKKKKARRTRFITMVVVELLTLVCIFAFSIVYRYMHMTADVAFDVNKVRNDNIDVSQKQKMSGYWTVAVFGVDDSCHGGVGKGANADVQIIANIDMGSGDIILTSVYRDTYLYLGNGSRYSKSNAAYAQGGPEQAVAMLNQNLDLDIENYITFNWKGVADAIELLGGIDVDVSKAAFYYMNAYIHETCLKTGISAQNPAAMYIQQPGLQHLNGIQAVAYARLRYMDNDFERTKRQREVISQCLSIAKKSDLATLTKIIDTVLSQVAFNIDTADIIELAKGISRYNIRTSVGFPKDLKDQMMGGKGACVIPTTLESNVVWLHSVLFADENYSVSDAVKRYSRKISEDSTDYANRKKSDESADQKPTKSSEDETEKKSQNKTESETSKADETKEDETRESETDEGEVIEVSTKETTESETRESKTDEGEIIEEPTKETAEGGTRESETDEGEIIEASTKETAETVKAGTNESKTETVEEPGKLPETDHDGQDGPA